MLIDSKSNARQAFMGMEFYGDISEGEKQRVFNVLYSLKVGRLALITPNRELLNRLTYLLVDQMRTDPYITDRRMSKCVLRDYASYISDSDVKGSKLSHVHSCMACFF